MIVVPLRVHGEVVGSLNLTRVGGPEAPFSEQEFELCKLFAGQASIALQNAEAHVTMATRADLDALTGLRNHGTFQRDLASVIEAGKPFSLLMMDLDSFKAFNDTYGHPAGDALLQAVAQAIVSAIRQNDSAYRYGGDEFALLLIGASSGHAAEVTARVRRAVREGVRASPVGALGPEVSASIGASHWPADGPAGAALVEAADAALYRAKRVRSERSGVDVAAMEPARSRSVSDALVDAAHDLAGAATREEVAQATACHAAALCGASDAFVAFLNGGPASGESPAHKPRLRTVAASGQFQRRASDTAIRSRVLAAGPRRGIDRRGDGWHCFPDRGSSRDRRNCRRHRGDRRSRGGLDGGEIRVETVDGRCLGRFRAGKPVEVGLRNVGTAPSVPPVGATYTPAMSRPLLDHSLPIRPGL